MIQEPLSPKQVLSKDRFRQAIHGVRNAKNGGEVYNHLNLLLLHDEAQRERLAAAEAKRDEYRQALCELRTWAHTHLDHAIQEDFKPGDEETTDALVSARRLIRSVNAVLPLPTADDVEGILARVSERPTPGGTA